MTEDEVSVAEPAPSPTPQIKTETVTPIPVPATTLITSNSLTSVFQQSQPPPATSQPQQTHPQTLSAAPHHNLPSSISQPIAPSQTSVHANSPLQQFAQQVSQQPPTGNAVQPSNQPPHLQHHLPLPQQLNQSQAVPSYNPHGAPIHLEPSQQTQTLIQQTTAHSTYFRGADASTNAPYFHAATPVTQPQDGSYGSFGQLSAQGQHLGTFNNSEYGYNDTSRVRSIFDNASL